MIYVKQPKENHKPLWIRLAKRLEEADWRTAEGGVYFT